MTRISQIERRRRANLEDKMKKAEELEKARLKRLEDYTMMRSRCPKTVSENLLCFGTLVKISRKFLSSLQLSHLPLMSGKSFLSICNRQDYSQ
jgi:hypothetical protein